MSRHFLPSARWFRTVCGLAVVMLVSILLWNPMAGVVDDAGSPGIAVAEVIDDHDQSPREASTPAAVDTLHRPCRDSVPCRIDSASLAAIPEPLLAPPERPPRA